MRKFLLCFLMVLMVFPSVFAARKKDKAGKVTDNVYTDKKFNFSLNLNEEWNYKIQKNKSSFRMVLTQINYAVPPEYAETPDYTKTPRMVLFVLDTKLSPSAFIDSLISKSYKSNAKKNALKECEILNMVSSTGFVPEKLLSRKKKTLRVADFKGSYWTGQVKYTNEVSRSASSRGGKRVKGSYGGGLAAVKVGDKMVLLHVIAEWNYFELAFEEAISVIKTLKLN